MNTVYINPQNVISISRGDKQKMKKYFLQFLELVPPRMNMLKQGIRAKDPQMVRQVVHQMKPQIQFFEVQGMDGPMTQLLQNYQTMPWKQIVSLVKMMLSTLQKACKEVKLILRKGI